MFTLIFHEFLHTMYKCMLNSVVKISLMFAKYFEYYGIILGGGVFCGHAVDDNSPRHLTYWFILTLSRSSSKVKVIGQSLRSHEEKGGSAIILLGNGSCCWNGRPWLRSTLESHTVNKSVRRKFG